MKKRFLFHSILDHLDEKEITLIQGSRQTGKTTLLEQVQRELISRKKPTTFLSLEDKKPLVELNEYPPNLFRFSPPMTSGKRHYFFIDEIQYLDNPANFLKHLYDIYKDKIKLIVSSSSGFYIDKKFKDSLAGRKQIFELQTMGFKEFLFFRGYEEMSEYVHTDYVPKIYINDLKILLDEYLLYGGYPKVVLSETLKQKQNVLKEIGVAYVKKDIDESSIIYPEAYRDILSILSKQVGNLFNLNTAGKSLKIKSETVQSYLYIMVKSFHIALVKPFYKSAVTELRKMKKAYFQDLGLRNFFAGNFNPILLRDDRGELLENYVYRLFADHYDTDWDIKYWRTQKKQEVDFIIQEKQAFEVKFSDKLFKPYKYKFFKNKYPDIPFKLLTYNNVLEFSPGGEKLYE